MIDKLESLIYKTGKKTVGFCGASFKPNTDDIRNSPMTAVIRKLTSEKLKYQEDFEVYIADNEFTLSNLNSEFGKITTMFSDPEYLISKCELIVLGPYKVSENFIIKAVEKGRILIDLKWHILEEKIKNYENYLYIV